MHWSSFALSGCSFKACLKLLLSNGEAMRTWMQPLGLWKVLAKLESVWSQEAWPQPSPGLSTWAPRLFSAELIRMGQACPITWAGHVPAEGKVNLSLQLPLQIAKLGGSPNLSGRVNVFVRLKLSTEYFTVVMQRAIPVSAWIPSFLWNVGALDMGGFVYVLVCFCFWGFWATKLQFTQSFVKQSSSRAWFEIHHFPMSCFPAATGHGKGMGKSLYEGKKFRALKMRKCWCVPSIFFFQCNCQGMDFPGNHKRYLFLF